MEDDLDQVAGRHLKRMAYLMAVTWKVAKTSQQETQEIAGTLFEKLNQRRRRRASDKKSLAIRPKEEPAISDQLISRKK